MNLADPELEFIDPTPNVHSLFIHFDSVFFWAKLAGKAVVRWSKRMYSCAGVCSYEGRGGICDIALSEPLLKLRPRKDLVETLLHEMIHAYLFVVGKDQCRDGHGPNFLSHMHRINQAAGINISVYHDFHDEVKLYQNHVWRCNGPCQKVRPFFGIVRRSNNRAPGPSDCWWNKHKRFCGGTFIKCSEPERVVKPTKQSKKKVIKPNVDITKYIININNETIKNKNADLPTRNSINGFNKTFSPKAKKDTQKTLVFNGSGQTIGKPKHSSTGVEETVRNVWANKTLPPALNTSTKAQPKVSSSQVNSNKRISDMGNSGPPKKMKKIEDYFKTTASNILKDVYGKDFQVTQSTDDKLKAVAVTTLLTCPICDTKVSEAQINVHIDECLNKDIIEKITKDSIVKIDPSISQTNKDPKNIDETIDCYIPKLKPIFNDTNTNNNWLTINTVKPETKIENDSISNTKPSTSSQCIDLTHIVVKEEPRDNSVDLTNPTASKTIEICPCCGKQIDKPVREHLDECLIFFDTSPEDTSIGDRTIVIDDSDDEFDETQTFNATGTKSPCPCCMKMVEDGEMNNHLDLCLG